MAQPIQLETVGRRVYLRGNTYPIKDRLRDAGAKWDADAKAWYVGTQRRALAEQLAAQVAQAPSAGAASSPDRQAPGTGATVAGRAEYKGRTYYVAGRAEPGRSRYDREFVHPVVSGDGSRVLLYSRDGSLQFWARLYRPTAQLGHRVSIEDLRQATESAPADQARIVKTYDRPQTIAGLARFAEDAKRARAQGYEDGIPEGRQYECEECGERVTRGVGSCWETGHAH